MSYSGQPGGNQQQGGSAPQGGSSNPGGYYYLFSYPQGQAYGFPQLGYSQGAVPSAAYPHGHVLNTNQTLSNNQGLRSPNGVYHARMQADNNFVIYKSPSGECDPKHAICSTNTGQGTNGWIVMQADHNLVVYNESNSPLWASNTIGRGAGNVRLIMQDDGNLVLYDQLNQPLWASNTCGR
jgi:hypothetical protein